eukprot:UN27907
MVFHHMLWLCGHILLPRTITVLDFVVSVIVFCTHQKDEHDLSRKMDNQLHHFQFETDTIDCLFISFFLSFILFWAFAYKYQREGYYRNVQLALVLAISSSVYLFVKVVVAQRSVAQKLSLIILISVWVELGVFFLVRRRRIRMAHVDFDHDDPDTPTTKRKKKYSAQNFRHRSKNNHLDSPDTPISVSSS